MSVAVDSLMWSRPDSALVLLQEHLDPKSHYAQTNRMELMAAVAYYDSLVAADTRGASRRQRDAFLDAHAHSDQSYKGGEYPEPLLDQSLLLSVNSEMEK